MNISLKKNRKDLAFTFVVVIFVVILFFIKTGFEPEKSPDTVRCKAKVVSVDNSEVRQYGIVKIGLQKLQLRILSSKYEDRVVTSENQLIGKMELDKIFSEGDVVYVTLETENGNIHHVNVIDHYRLHVEFALLVIFAVFLIAFAGYTGLKAMLSFIFAALCIWKLLLPAFLKGYDPLWISLAIVSLLTFVIIFLVGGVTRKGLAAFLGAAAGIILTCILAIVFGRLFRIHGAVKPFSETLLYSGYGHLNLSHIFLSGIFIAASGAVMDIAMDIASSQNELHRKHPEISRKDLILSGFSVGRAVIGTMTTTLLLAYSGSYTTLLMVFMAQRVPTLNMLNITYVASEILHTLVGSFGLLSVAPLTAIIGGFIFTFKKKGGAY